ncbi:hypothetical protein NC652_031800 [Populus alba x Populus x berolinensis]|uniref:Uncharacterized protein n=1 Tax=Populus alba x Populus x berolinensis TaxID=444605 RepID=A0AAD6LYX0_9ROSI|nr:hypothetical protein NC652_031800 [Populus alba x Populus x berolinensis]KAJ6975843.1 hypothetical protein NC653_031618 [Populus alba x Populus x berolinensis]
MMFIYCVAMQEASAAEKIHTLCAKRLSNDLESYNLCTLTCFY